MLDFRPLYDPALMSMFKKVKNNEVNYIFYDPISSYNREVWTWETMENIAYALWVNSPNKAVYLTYERYGNGLYLYNAVDDHKGVKSNAY